MLIVSSGVSIEDAEAISQFLRKRLNGRPAIIGASSGIDSSVVAALASRALPKESVKIFFMPDSLTSKSDYEDVERLSRAIGINIQKINIQPVIDIFIKVLNATDKKAIGNIKSRIRMIMLYYHANLMGGMVLGTTNKTESLIGYYTKYGDGGCDIEPIIHLYKNQVKALAKLMDIPESIINKKPSAGLWESQTDEDELGISYDRLDEILVDIFESGSNIVSENHKRVMEMHRGSEHKRRLPVSIEDDD